MLDEVTKDVMVRKKHLSNEDEQRLKEDLALMGITDDVANDLGTLTSSAFGTFIGDKNFRNAANRINGCAATTPCSKASGIADIAKLAP